MGLCGGSPSWGCDVTEGDTIAPLVPTKPEMPGRKPRQNIIRGEDFNKIIDKMIELSQKVAALEATMKPWDESLLRPAVKKWTIALDYDANNDEGKKFRARSAVHVESENLLAAYEAAEKMFLGSTAKPKFGAIVPGWHLIVP